MQKLTKEQAVAITGYTGITMCRFDIFHEDVEKRMGCSIFTHQFANKALMEEIKALYKDDFMALCVGFGNK